MDLGAPALCRAAAGHGGSFLSWGAGEATGEDRRGALCSGEHTGVSAGGHSFTAVSCMSARLQSCLLSMDLQTASARLQVAVMTQLETMALCGVWRLLGFFTHWRVTSSSPWEPCQASSVLEVGMEVLKGGPCHGFGSPAELVD